MSEAGRRTDVVGGTLTVDFGDSERTVRLTPEMAKSCIAALARFSRRDGTRHSSRTLGRNESIRAKEMRDDGWTTAEIALEMRCSPGSVNSAIRRVENGRYDDDPFSLI